MGAVVRHAVHAPASVLCVRCGRRPQARDTLLCAVCLTDDAARQEVRALLALGEPPEAMRRYAVAVYHWAGGWPTR